MECIFIGISTDTLLGSIEDVNILKRWAVLYLCPQRLACITDTDKPVRAKIKQSLAELVTGFFISFSGHVSVDKTYLTTLHIIDCKDLYTTFYHDVLSLPYTKVCLFDCCGMNSLIKNTSLHTRQPYIIITGSTQIGTSLDFVDGGLLTMLFVKYSIQGLTFNEFVTQVGVDTHGMFTVLVYTNIPHVRVKPMLTFINSINQTQSS